MEPTYRCGTRKAIDELAEELGLPNDLIMQDWSYEVANSDDIEKYFKHYEQTSDADKKFVLMEIIIQATEEQPNEKLYLKYCNRIKTILRSDFDIHEYTIYYWSLFDNENLDDCWKISAFMRQIWADNKKLN